MGFQAFVKDSRRQGQGRSLVRRQGKAHVERQMIPEKRSSVCERSISYLKIRRIRRANKSDRRRRPGINFVLNS